MMDFLGFRLVASMFGSLSYSQRVWVSGLLAAAVVVGSRRAAAQPGPNDPPVNYEVQIDGESFQVEGNQRPVKVQSKLKPGTTYTLAVRVAMTQPLRLNSVQMDYGMWAKVNDDRGKDLRVAKIVHDLGFSLEVTDLNQALDAAHRDELLKTLVDSAVKGFRERKFTGVDQTEPKTQKFGQSDGKWSKIHYTDLAGVARSWMVFVLWGEGYTVSAIAEFRDQDKDEVGPWVMNILASIRPVR